MNRKRRRLLIALGFPAVVVLFGLAWAGYSGYDYTESTAFCTNQCHVAMSPQSSAHARSPHSGVACVHCHAAGGAGRKLQTKLAGTSRIVRVALSNYQQPIHGEYKHSASVNAQCSACHRTDEFPTTKPISRRHFRFDENNTPEDITLTLKLGPDNASNSSAGGTHSHVLGGVQITYASTDPLQQDIAWVRVRRRDGTQTTYVSDSKPSPATVRSLPEYGMDCITCHNRAGHRISTPEDSLDQALRDAGTGSTSPWFKRVAVDIITNGSAWDKAGPRHALFAAYQAQAPGVLLAQSEDVERSSVILARVLRQLSFPGTGVSWDTYPDNLGHRYWPGCFRCHDGRHTADDGKVLASDCDHTCHSAPVREPHTNDGDWHPWPSPAKTLDILEHRQLTCSDCHRAGRVPKHTCDDCHSG